VPTTQIVAGQAHLAVNFGIAAPTASIFISGYNAAGTDTTRIVSQQFTTQFVSLDFLVPQQLIHLQIFNNTAAALASVSYGLVIAGSV
jgi:hypothetical protein